MELSFTHDLYDVPGPWTSVYIDITRDTEPGRSATRIRWRDLRESLRDQAIDGPTLSAVERELVDDGTQRALDSAEFESSRNPGRHGVALFAAHGKVHHAEIMEEPPSLDVGEVSPLPYLRPLLSQRGERVSWLRVVVDRVGADIGEPGHETVRAEGTHLFPIRKNHGGGWSEDHLHRKAELRWQHNAGEVARQVVQAAESAGAELLIVAGDIRARQLLIDQLPERWRTRTVAAKGGSRAPGADPTSVERATSEAIADAVARHRSAAIDRFLVHNREYGATGVPAVVAAFVQRQVETLLLDANEVVQTPLWVGLDGMQIAPSANELEQLGAQHIERVRAEDALIRAAALTDAEVVLVSPEDVRLEDGIGAVLRYADPADLHRVST